MKNLSVLLLSIFLFSCGNTQNTDNQSVEQPSNAKTIIQPIPLDKTALSGVNLKSVNDPKQPDRKLFQQNLFNGSEIAVYVVSSETKSAMQDNYGIDEFIYLYNGRARLNPKFGKEVIYNTGDFFLTPKGFTGEWETQGGNEFHYELSVIAKNRPKKTNEPNKALPYLIDKAKLSGIGLTKTAMKDNSEFYRDVLYKGVELEIILEAEKGRTINMDETIDEQLVYVIAGTVSITPTGGKEQTFYTGDFFVLPRLFSGTWESKGHHLFRTLRVKKSK